MKRILLLVFLLVIVSGCAKKETEVRKIFYPQPPTPPRLQYVMSIASGDDLQIRTEFEQFLGGPELDFKGLVHPYDLASAPGKIYILDRHYNKVIIVNLLEKTIGFFDDQKQREGQLSSPGGIYINQDEIKYISDMNRKQVIVYDATDNFVRTYGDKTIFDKPVDIVEYQDRILVSDVKKHQVIVFDKLSGEVINTIGSDPGEGGLNLSKPTFLAIDKDGNFYVTDAFNFNIRKINQNGILVEEFGQIGDAIGSFARPKGLDVDKDGNLYVVDAANSHVQIFNNKTRLLLFFGGLGNEPGRLYLPSGLHIDNNNVDYFANYIDEDFKAQYLLYVLNMSGPNKLSVYAFGQMKGYDYSEESIIPGN